MPLPVTTLRSLLAAADRSLAARQTGRARAGYEDLLQKALERADRPMQAIAHAMLGRLLLLKGDLDGAVAELEAARSVEPFDPEAQGRLRGALARLSIQRDPQTEAHRELVRYAEWAEHVGAHAELVDACMLGADASADPDMAIAWLRRAITHALDAPFTEPLGRLYDALAAAHERRAQFDDALDAWQQGLPYHRRYGSPRELVAALWASGSTACRLEDYPLARALLEEAIAAADGHDEAAELVPLALGDLAVVYEAAGDVVEARRLVLRSAHLGEQQDLRSHWPERWDSLRRHAERLELEL